MLVTVNIDINKSVETVWRIITDIEHCERFISSITKIKVINKPPNEFVGLKWEETRNMFGKESTETMWITDAKNNEYYQTRAESHGAIYISKLILSKNENGTLLTMSFSSVPQTRTAKILSFLMNLFIENSIKKALIKDMEDIKLFVESNESC